MCTPFDIFDKESNVTGVDLRWCGETIEKISDGTDRDKEKRRYFKENEAALIAWDPVEEVGAPAETVWKVLKECNWNKDCADSSRINFGGIDYGIDD